MKHRRIHLLLCASALAVSAALSSCANAIPSNHSLAPSEQVEQQGNFYDAVASSELTKIKDIIDKKLSENGDNYVAAGNDAKRIYSSHEGIDWSYTVNDDNAGYILKVWTPAGGTFNTEEKAMSIESYSNVPEDDDHAGETAEEHAAR